jgi:hypothetical protein
MTIADAITEAMKIAGKPISAMEAYEIISARKLYEFKAKSPQSIVAGTIRKNCKGVDRKDVKNKQVFEEAGKGKYKLTIK